MYHCSLHVSLAGPSAERSVNERPDEMVRLFGFRRGENLAKRGRPEIARKSREKCDAAKLLLLDSAQAFQALGLVFERLGVRSVGLQGQVVAIELRRFRVLVFTGKNIGEN